MEQKILRGTLALQHDRERARPLLEAILSGDRSWEELSTGERRLLEGVPLIDLTLRQSFEMRYRDPAAMVRLAQAARLLTDALNPRKYGAKVLADLKARAWAELGNAYRVADDFRLAEESLSRATCWAQRGTQDLRLAARLVDLMASLLSDQRRFSEASEAADLARAIYEGLGEVHQVGRALISKGLFVGYDSQPERAIAFLVSGLKIIRAEREPKLERVAMHALALNLVDAGFWQEARALLEKNRRFFRRDKSRLNQLRFHWLEGKIAFGLEEYGKAEASLQIARLGFRRAEQFYDSALVSLDLALLYARQGRRLEIRRLAGEMVQTFRAYRIAREAIASLLLLQKCSGQPEVSLDQLRGQIQTLSLLLAELERRPIRART